ncbi:MAG: hypothetical protein RL514_1032 [Verrucomicrobiota bacterium]|jgi:ubiquinone biosynthesis protein Coq4
MDPVRRKSSVAQAWLTLRGLIGLVRSDAATEATWNTEEGLQYSRANQLALQSLTAQPEVAPLIRERYQSDSFCVERLLQCPAGSLGHAFATRMTEEQLDPNFYRKVPVVDDASYIILRLRQCHDIWHVVTGFGTDEVGEISLKAFEMAQARRPVAAIIVAQFILKAVLKAPATLPSLFDAIVAGYQMGKTAKPFLAQRWEDGWDKPVSLWRAELGLGPVRAGA